jgi:hypothetical protein
MSDSSIIMNAMDCIICLNISRMRCCKNEKRWKSDCMIVKRREYDDAWLVAWWFAIVARLIAWLSTCQTHDCPHVKRMIVAGLIAWLVRDCRETDCMVVHMSNAWLSRDWLHGCPHVKRMIVAGLSTWLVRDCRGTFHMIGSRLVTQLNIGFSIIMNAMDCIICLNFSRMICCKNDKRWKNDWFAIVAGLSTWLVRDWLLS